MSRAILYARVSSDEQNKGTSPDDQIRRCNEYARMQGFTVVAELRDDYTGYSLERPAFDKVRAMFAAREADTLICLSGDRLARSVFVVSRIITEFLRKYRVNLHFVSRGRIDYDSPEGEFIMLMEAVGNQYWGTKAKEVMKNGRRALVKDGIKPGQGPNLYGYIKIGDRRETRYEIDEEAAKVIRRIFQEIADGGAILALTRTLNNDGIPIPSHVSKMTTGKRKDYGVWTPRIIRRIIKNEAYTGRLWLNRTNGTHGKDLTYNPPEEWIAVPMPQIVDRALFDAVQEALAGHGIVTRKGEFRQTFLMAGLIRCGHCIERGRGGVNLVTPMMRRSKERKYPYYICSKTLLTYLSKEERCPLPSVPRDKIDRAVWRFVEKLYDNPDAILASFQDAQEQRRRDNVTTETKIADLEETVAHQRTKLENLWLEMASLPKDAHSARTALHNVINRLDEAVAEGEAELTIFRGHLFPIPEESQLAVFWEHRDAVQEGVRTADTVEERRSVIDALNVSVSVQGVDGKIKGILHWWGVDIPLPLDDDDTPGETGSYPKPRKGDEGDGGVYQYFPILRAEWGHL